MKIIECLRLLLLEILITCSETLRNVRIKIPTAVVRGEDATLQCFYDLEGDKLYSVKWYRGGWEFFRYSPSEQPTIKQFKVFRGLNVREKDSRDTQVILENVTKELSGQYSCEVTADQPSFFTAIQTAELKVIELPKKDPQISGLKTRYKLEDTLRANCTSEGSQPAANLTWYINGVPVDETRLHHHHNRRYQPSSLTFKNDNYDLVTAQSSIKLHVIKSLFTNGKLKLRCSATMYHLYHKSSEKSVELFKKKHRPYNRIGSGDLLVTTTNELPFEPLEQPTERPAEATVEFGVGNQASSSSIITIFRNEKNLIIFLSVLIYGR